MSQSDYIKFKKTGIALKDLSNLPSVLPSSVFSAFTEYNIETTTPNESVNYGQVVPVYSNTINTISIFDTNINNFGSGCPSYSCIKTNTFANRKPLLETQIAPIPPRPKYVSVYPQYRNITTRCPC